MMTHFFCEPPIGMQLNRALGLLLSERRKLRTSIKKLFTNPTRLSVLCTMLCNPWNWNTSENSHFLSSLFRWSLHRSNWSLAGRTDDLRLMQIFNYFHLVSWALVSGRHRSDRSSLGTQFHTWFWSFLIRNFTNLGCLTTSNIRIHLYNILYFTNHQGFSPINHPIINNHHKSM